MADFTIWIVSPPGYIHSRCFEEVALSLNEAFVALGHTARTVTDPAQITGQPIVLGCNLLPNLGIKPPEGAILYNLEQVSDESTWLTPGYLDLLRAYRVWDYSDRNMAGLRKRGITPTLCGIGYMPGLTRLKPAAVQDIDVLFVGSLNARRQAVIQRLQMMGLRAGAAANIYGQERDALFMRARIVLNLHYYEAQVLEIVRVSYLLANSICVVSETGKDNAMEQLLAGGIAFAPYDKLVETCAGLLKNEFARQQVARAGFERFSKISQADLLRVALERTPDLSV